MKKSLLIAVTTFITIITVQAQVTQINNNKSLQFTALLNNVQTIVVSDIDSTVWVTDGNLPGPVQISAGIKFEQSGGLLAGKLIFSAIAPATGSELYITDGTAGGTGLLKDINTGLPASSPRDFAILNGFIYFTASTVAEGRELWRTDGTTGGTTIVKDIVTGPASSNLADKHNLFSNGSYLLLAVNTAAEGQELWRSDGTGAGTVLLKNINPGPDSSNPRSFYVLNNIVLFLAKEAATGNEIWKTDGTPGGTVIVKDINAGPASSTSLELFPGFSIDLLSGFHTFNNRAYFGASDGTSLGQVWGTDGTLGNTTLLKDIVPGATPSYLLLVDAVNLPTKFIFPISDGISRSELWQSDGTPAGTTLFQAFDPPTPSAFPLISVPFRYDITSVGFNQPLFQGNKFFFLAGTMTEGEELWISDGTPGGTSMVKDINPGAGSSLSMGTAAYLYTSTAFFFTADDGTHGVELWKSDGTLAGTSIVEDINLNAADADPQFLILNNNKVIFAATDGDDAVNTDLFVVDGSFIPLPVKLTGFAVTAAGKDALLQWYTTQEINVKGFTIQRSYDALHFENIGTVQAAGNADNRQAYTFTDRGIVNSGKTIVYYRLLTTDNDGKTAYSTTITLKLKGNQWNVQLMGNPVTDNINLSLTGAAAVHLSIKDVSGREVYNKYSTVTNNVLSVPASQLPRGIYVLVITNGDEKRSIRLVK